MLKEIKFVRRYSISTRRYSLRAVYKHAMWQLCHGHNQKSLAVPIVIHCVAEHDIGIICAWYKTMLLVNIISAYDIHNMGNFKSVYCESYSESMPSM